MKWFTSMMVALCLIGIVAGTTGCDITVDQMKVIAQNAGLFSAVGWVAVDNPSDEVKEGVVKVLDTIEDKVGDVQGGATYAEVLYPEAEKIIDKELEAQYRPIAKAAVATLLGGLDMLFAAHPEWKDKQDDAAQISDAFIVGAKRGLEMAKDDPVMVEAMNVQARRARIYKPE